MVMIGIFFGFVAIGWLLALIVYIVARFPVSFLTAIALLLLLLTGSIQLFLIGGALIGLLFLGVLCLSTPVLLPPDCKRSAEPPVLPDPPIVVFGFLSGGQAAPQQDATQAARQQANQAAKPAYLNRLG